MRQSLKESFLHLALVRQYLQDKGRCYKLVIWPASKDDYILHDFIKKYDRLLKNDRQLSEKLSVVLNAAIDPLHKGKRN